MVTCKVEGCAKPSVARGLCDKHRKRLARHGHLNSTRPQDWGQREKHPLYQTWHGMMRRCHGTHKDFVNYGARGIRVCERWRDFWAFVDDMGPRPGPEYTVERENNDRDYEPGNCRWATLTEQARNRRSSVITRELAVEIKRRAARMEKAGDIARSLGLEYDQVRNVIVGNSWGDLIV